MAKGPSSYFLGSGTSSAETPPNRAHTQRGAKPRPFHKRVPKSAGPRWVIVNRPGMSGDSGLPQVPWSRDSLDSQATVVMRSRSNCIGVGDLSWLCRLLRLCQIPRYSKIALASSRRVFHFLRSDSSATRGGPTAAKGPVAVLVKAGLRDAQDPAGDLDRKILAAITSMAARASRPVGWPTSRSRRCRPPMSAGLRSYTSVRLGHPQLAPRPRRRPRPAR